MTNIYNPEETRQIFITACEEALRNTANYPLGSEDRKAVETALANLQTMKV
jgi:hypothetical protein